MNSPPKSGKKTDDGIIIALGFNDTLKSKDKWNNQLTI
jgi:hypothetical protein